MKDYNFVVACLFLASSLLQGIEAITRGYPVGDAHYCSPQDAAQPLYPEMDILPGSGFDTLRDIDMGLVLNYNYSLCRISKDGQYLLPNHFYLTPLRETSIEAVSYTHLTLPTIYSV